MQKEELKEYLDLLYTKKDDAPPLLPLPIRFNGPRLTDETAMSVKMDSMDTIDVVWKGVLNGNAVHPYVAKLEERARVKRYDIEVKVVLTSEFYDRSGIMMKTRYTFKLDFPKDKKPYLGVGDGSAGLFLSLNGETLLSLDNNEFFTDASDGDCFTLLFSKDSVRMVDGNLFSKSTRRPSDTFPVVVEDGIKDFIVKGDRVYIGYVYYDVELGYDRTLDVLVLRAEDFDASFELRTRRILKLNVWRKGKPGLSFAVEPTDTYFGTSDVALSLPRLDKG